MASSSFRLDGRDRAELRPLSLSLGELDRADGSGRFAFGYEAALASFSGPLEVRLREELPDRATLEVVHRPLEGVGATPSRALVTTLSALLPPLLGLGQHPRSLVQLIVQSLSPSPSSSNSQSYPTISTSSSSSLKTWPPPELIVDENDDDRPQREEGASPMSGIYFSARAAALNASTLAILDAGSIALKAMLIAVSLAYVPSRKRGIGMVNGNGIGVDGELMLDPTAEEEGRARSRHIFAWAFGAGISTTGSGVDGGGMQVDGATEGGEAELVWAESEGDFTRQEFQNASEQSKQAAKRILDFMREKLGEHFSNRLRQ